jgi:ribosome-associated translation inhibitor RaiA
MQRPLQITFLGIEHSDAIERRIRVKAAELERFSNHVTSCRVTVDAPHRRRHQGNLYTVRLDIRLPDEEIAVGRERRHHHAHEDVYVAIRDSFDAAVRQLKDYVGRKRAELKEAVVPFYGQAELRVSAAEGESEEDVQASAAVPVDNRPSADEHG